VPSRMVSVSASVNLPCTVKSRSSLLAPAYPGGPGQRAINGCVCMCVCVCVCFIHCLVLLIMLPWISRWISRVKAQKGRKRIEVEG